MAINVAMCRECAALEECKRGDALRLIGRLDPMCPTSDLCHNRRRKHGLEVPWQPAARPAAAPPPPPAAAKGTQLTFF